MKKILATIAIALACAAVSGCVVVPARPAYYAPAYGCYHCYR